MSATNTTTNYSLPLFIGTDKPAWLVDWNSAMSAIDAAIKGVDTDVQGAIVDISGLSSTVASHTSSISTISGQITVITTNLNTATGNINTINSLIGNGTPTTTDHTIIGAINEINARTGKAEGISYDNTDSGLTATNVQGAINENAEAIDTLNSALSKHEISSPTQLSDNTLFTCPSDGYFRIFAEYGADNFIEGFIQGSSPSSETVGISAQGTTTHGSQAAIFCKKDMKIKATPITSGKTVAQFYPIA